MYVGFGSAPSCPIELAISVKGHLPFDSFALGDPSLLARVQGKLASNEVWAGDVLLVWPDRPLLIGGEVESNPLITLCDVEHDCPAVVIGFFVGKRLQFDWAIWHVFDTMTVRHAIGFRLDDLEGGAGDLVFRGDSRHGKPPVDDRNVNGRENFSQE